MRSSVLKVAENFKEIMETIMDKDKKFPEQEAPGKNTDNAFVQVGEDGSPVIPSTTEETGEEQQDTGDTTGDS